MKEGGLDRPPWGFALAVGASLAALFVISGVRFPDVFAEGVPVFWSLFRLEVAAGAMPSEMVRVPPFRIAVQLSDQAVERLRGLNETVVVDASFSGAPPPGPESQGGKPGGLWLGEARAEMPSSGVVDFSLVDLPRERVGALLDPNYEVHVNVSSGRRSGPDNLLDCGTVQGRILDLRNRLHEISCKLLREQ